MPSAVITGCNSGIGHAFAELLLEEGYDVVATDREIGPKINSLGCPTFNLDVTSPQSIADFTKDYGPDKPLDLLLNIAGIMSPPETDSLTTVTQETLLKTFSVNTFGPLLLTSALLPNLTLATEPKVGIMSSRVGSISDNSSGGSYAYRASKTAANSVGKSMAVDLKEQGVAVILLHPGFVKTGLDKSGKTREMGEAIEPGEAAGKLWGVLGGKGLEDSGRFWHREGWEIAW